MNIGLGTVAPLVQRVKEFNKEPIFEVVNVIEKVFLSFSSNSRTSYSVNYSDVTSL